MRRGVSGLLVAVFAFLLVPGQAPAQPVEGGSCHVAGEASTDTWELQVTHDARQFRSLHRSESDPTRTIATAFDLRSARVSHEVSNATGMNASRARTLLILQALHEFRDRDADQRYGPGDEVVHRYDLSTVAGATLQVVGPVDGGFDVIAVYPINASRSGGIPLGTTPDLPGQLRLSFLLLESGTMVDGEWVPPTRILVEAEVLSFPFESNDTRLAVEVRLDGDAAIERVADGFVRRHGYARSEHRWGACATVDGSTYPNRVLVVGAPPAPDAQTVSALFSYPASDEVRQEFAVTGAWAPPPIALPAMPLPPFLGDAALFLVGVVVSILLVAATSWQRIRGP